MRAMLHCAILAIASCGACAAWAQALPGEPIRPLPEAPGADPARAALGRQLFYDARIARDKRHSTLDGEPLPPPGALP